jgi:hypothetical protein
VDSLGESKPKRFKVPEGKGLLSGEIIQLSTDFRKDFHEE